MREPSIAAHNIVKRFGSVIANDHVDLAAYPGEVLAVVGENGAGKTTLMNILSGLIQPDSGEILLRGTPVRFNSPRDAIIAGIGMVHQHFMLIPVFTVAENVVLGREPHGGLIYADNQARAEVKRLSDQYGLKLNPDDRIENLPVGLQQRVEILKVLYRGSDILIFDEPTAVLTPQETRELFIVLRDMARAGRTIIFITHKLKEVMAISDRVTVLRLGKVVANLVTSETSPAEIARYMVGRDVLPSVQKSPARPGEPILQVENLACESDRGVTALRGVSFAVRAGEILGLAGVEGNGQAELVEVLTGLRPAKSGTVLLCDQPLLGQSPKQVRRMGVAYIPEDRRERGLILAYTVADNLVLGIEDRPPFSIAGILRPYHILEFARRLIARFDIRPPRPDIPVANLSGGNQQKVVLAREFSEDPKLLIASQPTRGLDVGATEFVHEGLVQMRDRGVAVLLVSAELDEIMALADRIAVIYEGQIMGIFDASTVDENQLGLLMTGGAERAEEQAIDLHAPALE